jgi:hypothetical protein
MACVSPDGQRMVTASFDKTAQVWLTTPRGPKSALVALMTAFAVKRTGAPHGNGDIVSHLVVSHSKRT